ncbi:MAG TPA: hypothetical protein DDY20_09705 [Desulfobulbaceae bacterium]|nr:hypothetical protein [Desulfobulbaceae bacterium]
MKKFLSTALALGLVAGLAATASALELKVTGKYVVDGYYIDQGNAAAGRPSYGVWPFDDSDADSDSWYEHTFQMYPTLIINDKVSMKGDIRFIGRNNVWGSQDDLATADGGNFEMDKAWLEYTSPVGMWQIGRQPAGAWQYAFVNNATKGDRIKWNFPTMDKFKSYVFLEKQTEQDGYWSDLGGAFGSDDKDYYEAAGGYEAEGVKAWLGLGWTNNNLLDYADVEQDTWRIKGYGEFVINPTFSMLGEFDYKFGEIDYPVGNDVDTSGLAAIVAGVGKFDALTATLGYFYMSGDNDASDDDMEAYDVANGTGWDFQPLYIMTGDATNVLNGYRGANIVGTTVRTAGVHAVMLLADYAASQDLTLHGGVAYGMAADEPDGVDDSYGWEFDLGLAYKLYDNLTYELHFGWWAVGDFAELGGLMDTEDVLLLSHHLSMKF